MSSAHSQTLDILEIPPSHLQSTPLEISAQEEPLAGLIK